MKSLFRCAFTFCLLVCLAKPAFSQNSNTGEIRGTVTDPSGAVVPGANVDVTNIDTGEKNDYTTNDDGLYDTVSTPTGNYTITVSAKGFKTVVIGPVTLNVSTIKEDAKLEVGTPSETVTVSATGVPLLQTETGAQGEVMESKEMSELPQVGTGITGADWASFNIFLPGAGGTTQGRNTTDGAWNAADAASINGNLPNFDNFLQDGASTILPASYNNDDAIFDSVQEVQINTSSFSAQYGMGGVVFNQITKSGTNTFHGSLYETWENDFLNAGGFFGNQQALTETNPLDPSGPQIPNPGHEVPRVRYNQFGGSVGGPVIKNKLFFFFDVDKIVNNDTNTGFVTLPTANELAGNFTGMYPIYDPSTTSGTSRTQFTNNMIPTADINSVSKAILSSKYGWPTAPLGVGQCVGGLYPNQCQNNAFLTQPGADPVLRYFGRGDYIMSSTNRISASMTHKNNPATNNGLLPCPEDCGSGDVNGVNAQITDTWTISPTVLNEFRMGYTRQGNFFLSGTIGLNPATAFGLQNTQFNQMPFIGNTSVYGGFGGPDGVNVLGPSTDAIYVENSFDPSDTVTLIRGKHILHFGVEVLMSEGNTTAWGSNSAGNYGFTGQYTAGFNSSGTLNTGTSGSGFADFLLGDVQGWASNNQGIDGMRMKSPQAFVQDDFKVKPNLTINLGLRWTGNTGMSEVDNRFGDFDQNLINPVGPFAGTAGSVWFAGQDDRTTLMKPIWDIFLPRVGFAWQPRPNTTVRGGFGMFAYNYSQDLYGGEGGGQLGYGATFQGSNSDPNSAAGDKGWVSGCPGNTTPLLLSSSAAMAANCEPYVAGSTNPATYISNPVKSPPYLNYNTQPGRIMQWTLSIQHQFGGNMALSVSYVGSHSSNLQYVTDLNQITNPAMLNVNDVENCNGATPASIAASPLTCARPYPAFGGLGGSNFNGIANYDSLQVVAEKRFSNGLTFNMNYAWSHMLDDQDSAGWGSTSGAQDWQIGNNPAANYGNSNFDIPNAFKGTWSYELPFGSGKAYLNHNHIEDAVVGGLRIAGTFIVESGTPFTVLDNGVNDYSQAGNVFADPVSGASPTSGNCPNGAAVGTLKCWFNYGAFETPAEQGNGSFGTVGRNTLFGPHLFDMDLSAAKTFHFGERFAFTIRADAVNALNHPSFSLPDNSVSDSGAGGITSVSNASRTMALSGHFTF
jgi:hypothetical protein